MARLFADENFPLPVVEWLRGLGHDVVTMQDAGRAGQAETDGAILRFASADNRAVLTLNRKDFIRLHSAQPDHGGIIVGTFDPDFVGQAARIHGAIDAEGHLTGRLIRVNRPAP